MTKEELVDLVTKIKRVEGTEQEIDNMLELFLKNVPDPNASNLIYYAELSSEEIVDKALSYKPFYL